MAKKSKEVKGLDKELDDMIDGFEAISKDVKEEKVKVAKEEPDTETSEDVEEEAPWFKVTFKKNSIEVEMHDWGKINAFRIQQSVRAVTKERARLRKLHYREERRNVS